MPLLWICLHVIILLIMYVVGTGESVFVLLGPLLWNKAGLLMTEGTEAEANSARNVDVTVIHELLLPAGKLEGVCTAGQMLTPPPLLLEWPLHVTRTLLGCTSMLN